MDSTDNTDNTNHSSVPDAAPTMVDDTQHHHHHQDHHHHDNHNHDHHMPIPDEPDHAHPIHPGGITAGLTTDAQPYLTAFIQPHGRAQRSWQRKASPYWVLWINTGMALSIAMSLAPKFELFNQLACVIHYSQFPSDIPTLPIGLNDQISRIAFAPSALESDGISFDETFINVSFGGNPLPSVQQVGTSEVEIELGQINPVLCRRNPAVQAITAKFNTALGTLLGVTSALTTGWWTRMSDKWGRKPVLIVAMASMIIGDVIFLLTTMFPTAVPGGYRFLYVGAILSGLSGGSVTITATKQAYIADCTPSSKRSQFFASLTGMAMVGLALGPLLGVFIIIWFSDALSVFYVSLVIRMTLLVIVILLLPESLSAESMEVLRAAEREQSLVDEQREAEERRSGQGDNGREGELVGARRDIEIRIKWVIKSVVNKIWTILSPLAIFWPNRDESSPKGKRDWNLTLLAIGFCLMMLSAGSGDPMFQYTQLAFGWGPAEISFFISIYGAAQAVYLLIFLPLVIKLFRSTGSSSTDSSSGARSEHRLILCSVVIGIITYFGIILSTTPIVFTVTTILSCIGEGVVPITSSLALYLVNDPTSTGKLLGAMSILAAVLGTVLGPVLFGLTYAATAKNYPKAIFTLIMGLAILAFIAFLMIRIREKPRSTEDGQTSTNSNAHSSSTVDERSPLLTRDE